MNLRTALLRLINSVLKAGTSNTRAITMKIPIRSKEAMISWTGSGATAYSAREPSNGGIGIMLKTNSATLIWIKITNTLMTEALTEPNNKWAITPQTIANAKLVNGPAKPTNDPTLLDLSRARSYGSGYSNDGLNETTDVPRTTVSKVTNPLPYVESS